MLNHSQNLIEQEKKKSEGSEKLKTKNKKSEKKAEKLIKIVDRKKNSKPRSWIEMGHDIDGKLSYLEVTDFGLKKSSKVRKKIKPDKNSFIDSDSCKNRHEVKRN